jgi:hypothetical protein
LAGDDPGNQTLYCAVTLPKDETAHVLCLEVFKDDGSDGEIAAARFMSGFADDTAAWPTVRYQSGF